MDISFPNIPAGLKIPLFHLEFAGSSIAGSELQRTLLVANTITAQPVAPIRIPSVAYAVALFGAKSLLAQMAESYFAADLFGEVWALPYADAGGGVKSVGSVSFTGVASAVGVLALYVAGKSIPVAVTNGMTAAQMATAAVAAINAFASANGVKLPCTAAVDGAQNFKVNLTAENAGTHGNSIDIRLNYYGAQGGEVTPAGFTVAIVQPVNGATDPDISGIAAVIGSDNYDFVAIPWATTTQFDIMKTLMANDTGRWSWTKQIYGGVFAAKRDADNTGTTNLAFGAGRNDAHLSCMSLEVAPSTPWAVAASYAGAAASSLRADPARPLQRLSLPGILAPAPVDRYSMATRQALLSGGMAVMSYSADGTCKILRAVTTYQKNEWGSPDISYLDTETLYTLMAVVRQLKGDVTSAFPRSKLADDGTNFGPGTTFTDGEPDQPITTPSGIRSTIIASYSRMIERGLVQDLETFNKGLIVQRNSADPSRVDVLFDPVLVSGLRILAVLTRFYLRAPAAGSVAA